MISSLVALLFLFLAADAFKHSGVKRSSVGRRYMHTNDLPSSPNQRALKQLKNVAIVSTLLPFAAYAGFFSSREQDLIDELSKYQKPVAELLDQLRPTNTPNAVGVYSVQQILRGGKEDSDVVLNYLSNYILPMQKTMADAAPSLKLPVDADNERISVLPLIMKGHILELQQAIESQKAESQAREVEEVQETLAEFLKLASSKYEVKPYIPTRPITDAELFGPLGCEFWGKKRVPGSNSCE